MSDPFDDTVDPTAGGSGSTPAVEPETKEGDTKATNTKGSNKKSKAEAKAEAEEPSTTYMIIHDRVGQFSKGESVSADQLGDDAIIKRLIDLGAISQG